MFDNSERFITRMKLRELRQQRAGLRTKYDQLESAVNATQDQSARLRQIYEGLRAINFANQPLHPEVNNLDVVLTQIDSDPGVTDLLTFWQDRLETELTTGRARSEIVYLFGLLLEEWALQEPAEAAPAPEQTETTQHLRDLLQSTPEIPDHQAFLSPLFARLGTIPTRHYTDRSVAAHIPKVVRGAVRKEDLEAILSQISNDIYRSGALRHEARQFMHNEALLKELVDALTIMIEHLDEWHWPEDGVRGRIVDARTKWRLFLHEDLPTACLLELIGVRWSSSILHGLFSANRFTRSVRLQRLIELEAPEFLIENERRFLKESEGLSYPPTVDIWAKPEHDATLRTTEDYARMIHNSIGGVRAGVLENLHNVMLFDRYSARDRKQGGSSIESAITLIHAEIALARGAFPDRPLYVIKIDLKDFYGSIPHDVLLTVLHLLGVQADDLQFFERYLKVPIQFDTDMLMSARGIPNGRTLSNMFAELLLVLLDHYIVESANVMIVRLLDDICILTPDPDNAIKAWRAVGEFCNQCGLAVNLEKSGAVCIGGTLPPELPNQPPTWMMLQLDPDGAWRIHEPTFKRYLNAARGRVNAAQSILSRVEVFNAEVEYLKTELALSAPLGTVHREAINRVLMQFDRDLLGGQRVVNAVTDLIQIHFPQDEATRNIPESWLYWPITAGGLGLKHIASIVTSFALTAKQHIVNPIPSDRSSDWQTRFNPWAVYYRSLITVYQPRAPIVTQIMETLVKDFIERGATLSSGKQKTLGPYWRWIVYSYGPHLLAHFGSFRFLITELVPLPLITGRRLGDTESGEEDVE
jgi:hypothetical protein